MNLNLSGHHIDISPALREYVTSKIKRVERRLDGLIGANVVLTVEKATHKAEATVHASGVDLHAESEQPDMYAAIDELIDKLDEQARRHNGKIHDHQAKKAQKYKLINPPDNNESH